MLTPLKPMENPTPTFLVMDDFYENPLEVREWLLKQEFSPSYIGCPRTKSYATPELKEHIQKFINEHLKPVAGGSSIEAHQHQI